ncbi:MAG: DUF559 domain-containing protein [Thaumarchaeota archaeon]|nr:DUF559 domain-containing protein [Nitrososphaerota archaeon]
MEGKVHRFTRRRTLDRIRVRALEAMGYVVVRVKNSDVQRFPDIVAEKIIQTYYEVCEADRNAKVIQINPASPESIPSHINKNIDHWATQINSTLIDENWATDYFRKVLNDYDEGLITNQATMDKLMLALFGLNLRKIEGGNHLDFERSAMLFGKSLQIMLDLFGDSGTIGIRNMLNISAPNFFKNLVFIGGPKINPRVVLIDDVVSLDFHVNSFNQHFRKFGISVEKDDVITEICEALKKSLGLGKDCSRLAWLLDLCE